MQKFLVISALLLLFSLSGAAERYAAIVNGTKIPLSEFTSAIESAKKNLVEQNSIDLESEEGKFILATTQRSILDDMIDQVIIQQQAAKMHINVTTADVQEELTRLRAGFPSQKVFEETLAQENINAKDLTEGVRSRLVSEKIKKELAEKIEISEKELNSFLSNNQDFFQTADQSAIEPPESVEIEDVPTMDAGQINTEAKKYLLRKKENEIFERWFAKARNTAKIEINPEIIRDDLEVLPGNNIPHPDKTVTNGRV